MILSYTQATKATTKDEGSREILARGVQGLTGQIGDFATDLGVAQPSSIKKHVNCSCGMLLYMVNMLLTYSMLPSDSKATNVTTKDEGSREILGRGVQGLTGCREKFATDLGVTQAQCVKEHVNYFADVAV